MSLNENCAEFKNLGGFFFNGFVWLLSRKMAIQIHTYANMLTYGHICNISTYA